MQKAKDLLKALWAEVSSRPTVVKLLHTFWQAGLAVWAVNGFALNKVVATAVLAAVLSAVKSFLVSLQVEKPGL